MYKLSVRQNTALGQTNASNPPGRCADSYGWVGLGLEFNASVWVTCQSAVFCCAHKMKILGILFKQHVVVFMLLFTDVVYNTI